MSKALCEAGRSWHMLNELIGGGAAHQVFASALVLVGALLVVPGCRDDSPSGDGGVAAERAGTATLTVDIVYPAGAVTAGFRPSAAVYAAASYPDTSKPPTAIPIAALLGADGESTLKGEVLNLGQTAPYPFEVGQPYVVVAAVAAAKGMPLPVAGKQWNAKSFSLQGAETVVIASDDPHWRP